MNQQENGDRTFKNNRTFKGKSYLLKFNQQDNSDRTQSIHKSSDRTFKNQSDRTFKSQSDRGLKVW